VSGGWQTLRVRLSQQGKCLKCRSETEFDPRRGQNKIYCTECGKKMYQDKKAKKCLNQSSL
jgi:hypothetical protein